MKTKTMPQGVLHVESGTRIMDRDRNEVCRITDSSVAPIFVAAYNASLKLKTPEKPNESLKAIRRTLEQIELGLMKSERPGKRETQCTAALMRIRLLLNSYFREA